MKEVIATASQVVGREIETRIGARRAGDPAVLIASSAKIKEELNWQPQYEDLKTIIETAWNWQQKGGYHEDGEK